MIAIYDDRSDEMYPIDVLSNGYDSLLLQYPIGEWGKMARAMMKCFDYLTPELEYEGRKFTIGNELKLGLNWGDHDPASNPQGMSKIEEVEGWQELADRLEAAYRAKAE